MVNAKQKGSRVERQLRDILRQRGIEARRTAQYCGMSGDASDVVVKEHWLSEWHIESKGIKKIYPYLLKAWTLQCERDSQGKPWAIFCKELRKPWKVFVYSADKVLVDMEVDEFLSLYS